MNWIASDSYLALFFEVSDEDLRRIENDAEYHRDESFMKKIYDSVGCNAVFYTLRVRRGKPDIRFFVGEMKKKYNSVSWWDREHGKFYIRRQPWVETQEELQPELLRLV